MTLKPEAMEKLTLLGRPTINPNNKRWAVFVTSRMSIKQNRYPTQLILFDLESCEGAPLLKEEHGYDYSNPSWSPQGDKLAFIRQKDHHVEMCIYHFPSQGLLTYPLHGKVKEYAWSPKNDRIAFVSRVQDLSQPAYEIKRLRYKLDGEGLTIGYTHIFILDINHGSIMQISSGESDHQCPAFDREGERLAYVQMFSEQDDELKQPYIRQVHLKTNHQSEWFPQLKDISALIFTSDDALLAVGKEMDENSFEFDKLYLIKEHKPAQRLLPDLDGPIKFSVMSDCKRTGANPALKLQGKFVIFTAASKGKQQLYLYDMRRETLTSIPINQNIIAFDVVTCDESSLEVIYLADSFYQPAEFFHAFWDYKEKIKVKGCTSFNKDIFSQTASIRVEHYLYEAPDQIQTEGWHMWAEDQVSRGTVLLMHGGPHAAYGETFFFDFWFLCSQGYHVVFCNPIGSTGYGQAFSSAVIKEWGKKDVEAILGFFDQGVTHFGLPSPHYIMGGSYAGYLVNWIISHNDRFQAAISERAISNLYSKMGNSDLGFVINRTEFGNVDLWTDEPFIMERSPIRYAHQVNTPVLIIHSGEDHRVPIEQGEQWYTALKRLGKKVKFMMYPGSSHAMAATGPPQQRISRLETICSWLESHGEEVRK
ncbi:putative peptidase YuxL [Pullulanibacillus camelliae]|uniref:Putative peptidase YuxL n=1 Tax=Pullulanibacillus camelliae TaxID=1707096 RepID=A0A8J2VCY6_9BACL|nr:S9 family peptidase [Pullulanibacillus camelliae]GGE26976.1 putative peptidase YuxL [Pullulanibacillus camelliae]